MEEQQEKKERFIPIENLTERVTEWSPRALIGAIALAFEVDPLLVADLYDYDLLTTPTIKGKHDYQGLNYAQWILKSDKYDNLSQLFSFLFDYGDYKFEEPWQHSEATKERLRVFVRHLSEKHGGNVTRYFEECALRLWLQKDYFSTHYSYSIDKAYKTLKAYSEGKEYIFSHFDYENRVIHYCK